MNDYEAKQEAKRERYKELAEKARQESEARHKAVNDICDRIPFGQPILVGHHSEKRARADQKRIHNGMTKAIEASKKAEYYERKAKAVGKGGISSDDPEAVVKLRAKLENLKNKQEYMKRINKIHTAYLKDPASLDKHELSENERNCIVNYKPQYSWEPHPFPPYALQNNNANIKSAEKRIKQLETRANATTEEQQIGNIRVVDNVEANRLQIFFPGKPAYEVRQELKAHGFRWTPSQMCWQGSRTAYNARAYIEKLTD